MHLKFPCIQAIRSLNNIVFKTSFIFIILLFPGCDKFISIPSPKTQLSSSLVFKNDADAISAISGIYSSMNSSNGFLSGGAAGINILCGLSADELNLNLTSPDYNGFFKNSISPNNGLLESNLWGEGYKYVYDANSIIAGLTQSNTISETTRNQILGEAKFIRALCYFYLTNLFGDVPLITTTDYQTNAIAKRASSSSVYQQIILDLKESAQLMSDNFSFTGGEKIRPNKWAAEALLARVYLYQGNWAAAENSAGYVIDSSGYALENDLSAVFLKNSVEAIWQLQPVLPNMNTNDGFVFILTAAPTLVSLSLPLVQAFEPGDQRKINWLDSISVSGSSYYYPFKYKVISGTPVTEYSMILRLAEQYLIRSEARAQQANFTGATVDLNIIRNRAGLAALILTDLSSTLLAIEQERRSEFFTELGHRWLDLKRTHRADAVLGPIKAPDWQSSDTLYPIPQSEIITDKSLTQNTGY